MLGVDEELAHPFGESPSRTRDLDAVKQDGCRLALCHPAVNRSDLLWTATGTNTLRLGETLLQAKGGGDFGALLARPLLGPGVLNGDAVRVAVRVVRRQRPATSAPPTAPTASRNPTGRRKA